MKCELDFVRFLMDGSLDRKLSHIYTHTHTHIICMYSSYLGSFYVVHIKQNIRRRTLCIVVSLLLTRFIMSAVSECQHITVNVHRNSVCTTPYWLKMQLVFYMRFEVPWQWIFRLWSSGVWSHFYVLCSSEMLVSDLPTYTMSHPTRQ